MCFARQVSFGVVVELHNPGENVRVLNILGLFNLDSLVGMLVHLIAFNVLLFILVIEHLFDELLLVVPHFFDIFMHFFVSFVFLFRLFRVRFKQTVQSTLTFLNAQFSRAVCFRRKHFFFNHSH